MTKTDKDQILATYKQQFEALCSQRGFASDMVEHYSVLVTNFSGIESPDFWSLGHVKQLADYCRQFVKFYDLYVRVDSDISMLSGEISVIKDLK